MLDTLASSSSAKEWLQRLQHLVIKRANKDCDNYSALVSWYQDDATVRIPSLKSPAVDATVKKQSKVNSWKHWRIFRWLFLKK
jgi:hypothetical protein